MTPRAPDGQAAPLPFALGAVAELALRDVGELTDGELGDALQLLVDVAGRVEALLCAVMSRFDASSACTADGAKTPAIWLAARAEVSTTRAGAVAHLARSLRSCPHVQAAFGAGSLGVEKVRMLCEARKVHPAKFAEFEADLVTSLVPLTVRHAAQVIGRWVALAQADLDLDDDDPSDDEGAQDVPDGDGDGPDPEAVAEGQPASRAHLSQTLGGRVLGDLDLDPVDGEELLGNVEAWIDRRFQTGTYRSDDGLTRSQRVAQALVDLTSRGSNPDATRHGQPRPSVTVTIDHRTLDGAPFTSIDELTTRSCNLDSGAALPRSTVERLLCTARIQVAAIRVLADGTIETVGEADHRRHPNRRQRRALERRDRGCVFPGCHAPPAWCDAHHLIPYEVGGPTLMANLVLVCKYHHHTVHEGGWRLRRSRDGTLRLRRPDGTPVDIPPHGTKLP